MNTMLLTTLVTLSQSGLRERSDLLISITLWVSLFLCLLNVGLAIIFRKRKASERVSYPIACVLELIIFVFALLLHLNLVTRVPYHLPPGLPVDLAELGAALTVGIGLFPAAYWHRINVSELPKRIAADAKVVKEHDASVRVRSGAPGEWMN